MSFSRNDSLCTGFVVDHSQLQSNNPSTELLDYNYYFNHSSKSGKITFLGFLLFLAITILQSAESLAAVPSHKIFHHSTHLHQSPSLKNDNVSTGFDHSVEGLNIDEIVIVISSTGKKEGQWFKDRILPSARTWMRLLPHVFVILEGKSSVFVVLHWIFIE